MSFRGDAKHRTTMCNCTSENLEIPRCAIAHLRSGPEPVIGRRKAPTRWDHPGMTECVLSLGLSRGQKLRIILQYLKHAAGHHDTTLVGGYLGGHENQAAG